MASEMAVATAGSSATAAARFSQPASSSSVRLAQNGRGRQHGCDRAQQQEGEGEDATHLLSH